MTDLSILAHLNESYHPSQNYNYELFGIVLHSGQTLHAGHYTGKVLI